MAVVKYCPICKEEKPVSEFGSNKSKPYGLQWACKRCHAKYQRERYRRLIARHNPSGKVQNQMTNPTIDFTCHISNENLHNNDKL